MLYYILYTGNLQNFQQVHILAVVFKSLKMISEEIYNTLIKYISNKQIDLQIMFKINVKKNNLSCSVQLQFH